MKFRKIVFPEAERVEVREDRIDLDAIGPNEIVVKTHYSCVSPGTEIACLHGKEPGWFRFPETPGYIAVGQVLARGRDVRAYEVGDFIHSANGHTGCFRRDLVTSWGPHRKLPADCDLKKAALAGLATIPLSGLRASSIAVGDAVGVVGLGMIGNLAAQLARLQGGRVLGFDTSPSRVERARQCGIEALEAPCDPSLVRSRIGAATGDTGFYSLIEASGSPQALLRYLDLVGRGGEVVLLGTPRDRCETDLTQFLKYIHFGNYGPLRFLGTCGVLPPRHNGERDFWVALDLLRAGRLVVEPLLTHVVRPDEAPRIYRGLEHEPDTYLGVLFDWTQEKEDA